MTIPSCWWGGIPGSATSWHKIPSRWSTDGRFCGHRSRGRRLHRRATPPGRTSMRSEEHTSELQSHSDLVCRLLLEKKKKKMKRKKYRVKNKSQQSDICMRVSSRE